MRRSVSQSLLSMLRRGGVRTTFGVPGAYSIDLNDAQTQRGDMNYVLASHEGGAAFMAQGYAQVTKGTGCVITTAGPGGLNAVTALASARADGDNVLFVHGEVPSAARGQGALQDFNSVGFSTEDVIGTVCGRSRVINSAEEFAALAPWVQGEILRRSGELGPTHLAIRANVFPSLVEEQDTTEKGEAEYIETYNVEHAQRFARDALKLIEKSTSPLLLVGHGCYRADREVLEAFIKATGIPTMVTARGVACVDHSLESFIGQHSIFPSASTSAYLESNSPDLLIAIGTSLGEFSSNSWSPLLTRIPSIIHCSLDARAFGRLKQRERVDAHCHASFFLRYLFEEVNENAQLKASLQQRSQAALEAFRKNADNLQKFSRPELLSNTESTILTGQQLVYNLGKALKESMGPDTKVNIVADTGCAKLYAAHYIEYSSPNWRCLMNSGTVDCLGYGLPTAIGAALGSRDKGENALTVCIVGDGGVLMQSEWNALTANAATKDLPLVVVILNDASLSYVHQGFVAVMGRALEATRFQKRVDFASIAKGFHIDSMVIDSPNQITPELIKSLVAKKRPVVLDCIVDDETFGPGLERYNRVRSILGKPKMQLNEMSSMLSMHRRAFSTSTTPTTTTTTTTTTNKEGEEVFNGGGPNRLHLYGIIYDVFRGCIKNSDLGRVQPDVKFGLGVSSFSDHLEDIGDAVYFNGRFFVRKTEAGERRYPTGLFKEGNATNYRTVYSLGVTKNPDDMAGRRIVSSSTCNGSQSMRSMLTSFIGPPRTSKETPGRIVGFLGLIDYHNFLGTSLLHAPMKNENILPVIDKYARPSIPTPNVSGLVMGFVRTCTEKFDPPRAQLLYERMFYNNPRDNDGRMEETGSSEFGAHWISHTHGIVLPRGMSIFGKHSVEDLSSNHGLRRKFLEEEVFPRRDWADCGHVIPGSTLNRYLFTTFDVHGVDVFNPDMPVEKC